MPAAATASARGSSAVRGFSGTGRRKRREIDEVICAGCGVLRRDLSGRGDPERGGGEVMTNRALAKDPYNIVITGVGGQGNVMASRVLANMLVRRGFKVTIGETFGMSQRGGSVMSHIRVSPTAVWSPQIPKGRADLIVAIEPIEAIRVLADYGNPAVKVLVNMRPIYPVGVITGEDEYPSEEKIREAVAALSAQARFLDATDGGDPPGQSDPGEHRHDRRRRGSGGPAHRPGALRDGDPGGDAGRPGGGQSPRLRDRRGGRRLKSG